MRENHSSYEVLCELRKLLSGLNFIRKYSPFPGILRCLGESGKHKQNEAEPVIFSASALLSPAGSLRL